MEPLTEDFIELPIPASERPSVKHAIWSICRYLNDVKDDFSESVFEQLPDILEYLEAAVVMTEVTPPDEPYRLLPRAWFGVFIVFDLSVRVLKAPDYFSVAMHQEGLGPDEEVLDFSTALERKEDALRLLEPFLDAVSKKIMSQERANAMERYLHSATRLPLPGAKGIRAAYAPFDEPFKIPQLHPEFRLAKYHADETMIKLYRNVVVDFGHHVVLMLIDVIIQKPDNLPARIIKAYLPDFGHYFNQVHQNLKPQRGTTEEFDLCYKEPGKHGFYMNFPLVIFGTLYIAYDLTLKLLLSEKDYDNIPAIIADRFGLLGEEMVTQRKKGKDEKSFLQRSLPGIADYFSFLSNELDLQGSTLVADYKAFSQQVPWWD